MKKYFVLPLVAIVMVLVMAGMASCSGNQVEKAVKQAFIDRDTTQARFDSICSIILANPKQYSEYLTPEGEINYAALNELTEQVGSRLRPPMHWNVLAYGAKSLSLTIYFERSGSMVPYDTPGGRGQLKKTVNDLINYFPGSDKVNINIVNDGIYPYGGTVDGFLKDRNIYASTEGVGNAAFTDFQKIFTSVLEAQTPGNVSVVVTDLIYSPADTKDVSIDKIFNEENSLATSVFKRYKGKSIVVHQLTGDYNGKYYPYNNNAFAYNGTRPFYVLIIADTHVMNMMQASKDYAQFLNVQGSRNSYRFNQGESKVDWCVLSGWGDSAGRFRVSRRNAGELTSVEADKTTGVLRLAIAANLSTLNQSNDVLCNAANYTVESMSGFKVEVKPVEQSMITPNNKASLEGKTHIITLTGDFKGPHDTVKLSLRNEFPQWIDASTSSDDTNPSQPEFSTTTLGLSHFLKGIGQAMGTGGNYFTIEISLKK
ncbi:MAG: hypothetical protein KBT13_10560 [Bacteroidales bacterium]|nr:hypothetical protein [Candidatus Sodaliphilus limicaballi]